MNKSATIYNMFMVQQMLAIFFQESVLNGRMEAVGTVEVINYLLKF